jgi:glycosyltransferase involved in cell wall biosynthesis
VDGPLSGRSIVLISSIDWGFLWQGHQEIAVRFAAAGARVFFVENTGVRTVRPSDAGRIVDRIRRSIIGQPRGERRTRDVTVVSPLVLPFPRSRIARAVNERLLLPRLARTLREAGASDPVLFTFLPTPTARRLIELVRTPRSVLVYWCIADFRELSDLGSELIEAEAAIVRSADLVFVQGRAFADRFARVNPRIHTFQFGVNLERFDVALPPADEVRSLPRPVIGYNGGLHRHVDVGLIEKLADAFPHGSLVLVGPLQRNAEGLAARRNVHLLGQRPFDQLPALIAGFDVGLIPYVRSAYTDTVFPTKLFEYLAMGVPVVSTDLPEVRNLGLPAHAVRVGSDADDVVDAVRASVAPAMADDRAPRAALARERDWRTIVARMSALIAEVSH